ncbi:MAG: MBL fold metallo-hydrolase [Chromatocurvus sp.]
MRFASLGSGSKGNATLVQSGDTLLMVDCGFSLKETRRRLRRLQVDPAAITAILVTHEHSDHISGVGVLARALGIPVYLTHGTARSGRLGACDTVVMFNAGESFSLGSIEVRSVVVPHDAREPCQYLFSGNGCRVGVLTDLGSITPHVVDAYRGCHGLLLEFNHCSDLLAEGPYPPSLKSRVGGDWGHLSNRQACELLTQIATDDLRQLAIAHISEQNNARDAVESQLVARIPGWRQEVVWADQAGGFSWLAVANDALPRSAIADCEAC